VKLTGVSPSWPADARPLDEGERLSVTYAFVITEKGDVTDFEVIEGTDTSSPVGIAVLTAYSRWKFSPALKDGVPVRVRVQRRHTFIGAGAPPTDLPPAGLPKGAAGVSRMGTAVKGGIWDEAAVDVRPKKVRGSAPEYPRDAPVLGPGQLAVVTVTFVVSESGNVSDMQVVESAGAAIDAAVMAAFKGWKFSPGTKGGVRVKVRVTRTHHFFGR
jgi:TonB family protein